MPCVHRQRATVAMARSEGSATGNETVERDVWEPHDDGSVSHMRHRLRVVPNRYTLPDSEIAGAAGFFWANLRVALDATYPGWSGPGQGLSTAHPPSYESYEVVIEPAKVVVQIVRVGGTGQRHPSHDSIFL